MKRLTIKTLAILLSLSCGLYPVSFAQDAAPPQSAPPGEVAIVDSLAAAQNVTLDFKEADINNVLKVIAYKAGVNIVTTPDVIGNVTIRLVDVPWEKALDVILKTHGFGYDRQANIITVGPIEKLTAQKKQELELAQVQPVVTEVFNLKYIDAQDAKKALEAQLSPRGRITILEMTGQAGWEFGAADTGKRKRSTEERMSRSKVLIATDIRPALDNLKAALESIDVMPKQVIIETRIMEVSRDKLRDIGVDYGTGSGGAETSAITTTPFHKKNGVDQSVIGGHSLGSQVAPAIFSPLASGITGVNPYNTGLELIFKNLTGAQFEVMLHALEEDVHTNTLSAPRIMTLSNQEATILVGTRYPILKQETVSTTGTPQTTITLDYYQDIGIQLNVVPQVGANNFINMVVHPAVTSFTQKLATYYPIIDTREAETRVFMHDGETIVIGGLLKDVKGKSKQGVPFLSSIPLLGFLFTRDTTDDAKIDLLIFITARVVKEGDFSPAEIQKLKDGLWKDPIDAKKKPKKSRK